jgi:dTDP-4-amino-4,6-dideoxygalactose transaminase
MTEWAETRGNVTWLAAGAPGRAAIPHNKPFVAGREFDYIRRAHAEGHLSGDGDFTRRCHQWLEAQVGCDTALLTHSCTAALEMAALLIDTEPGDEIIMPSFTFASTANAFALRGGVPVFVDIRADTLNIDETLIERAVTSRTKAIVPVHYAGVPCEMDAIMRIADRHGLLVIEDAAQAILSKYRGQAAGGIGHIGAVSFHETKNITCGEGGALLINREGYRERAHYIREKGTNRSDYLARKVDKYVWVDLGSSYLPSEVTAAFLWAQMEAADDITDRRRALWDRYHHCLAGLEQEGLLRRPHVPESCEPNAHMYHLVLPSEQKRVQCRDGLADRGITAASHYVPLHLSPAGRRLGRAVGELPNTESLSRRLLRLPMWVGLEERQHEVVAALHEVLRG